MRVLLCLLLAMQLNTAGAQQDNYGAGKANKRNIPAEPVGGGRSDFDYLRLADHPSASGVPLGGIGVGNVEFAPNGHFVRIGLNNIHVPIPKSKAGFFVLRTQSKTGVTVRRLIKENDDTFGMPGVEHTRFTGLFPCATLEAEDKKLLVKPVIRAWSSLVPQDVKNSSLPIVFFDVELTAKEDADISLAFSWEDFLGRGIKDPVSVEGMDGQILSRSGLMNGEEWPEMKPVNSFAESFSLADYKGVRQFTGKPIIPLKASFQNYVNELVLLARADTGLAINCFNSYDRDSDSIAWNQFKRSGSFSEDPASRSVLSDTAGRNGASIVSIQTHLKKGQKKNLHFILAWFYPELVIDKENAIPGSYWAGGSDYGRYFHRYFNSISELLNYAVSNKESLLKGTREWQQPVLESAYPDWLKFKLINSAYVIYTNMILNKKGDVTVNEGGMGGLAGTMDQRISSHPFYQKFFTALDRSEMEIFGDAQAFDGSINHFIGHYYVGMGTVGGRVPTENHWMLDNTEGWIIQIAKDFEQTGDYHYVRKFAGRIKDGMKFLKSKMPAGVEIPVGPTTYDDFTHPPIYSYGAGMYLAALKATETIALALNDTVWADSCSRQFERSQRDMLRLLWNGRFFSYGCEIDGSRRLDNILFTGQLAGQFVSRYCGWGDILPLDTIRSSLQAQMAISLSATPDYYANKVWDIGKGKGIDQRGSQCWPFYLESYTAYPAIQSGYVKDGMDIMKHIQLVHLRKGLTWSQNLWNPGNITYMTAPVSWFSTDVLMGAGINLPKGEIRLGPSLVAKTASSYPLFFPRFWANLRIDPQGKKVSLEITKTFGKEDIVLRSLRIEPSGKAALAAEIVDLVPFQIRNGNKLDLSRWFDLLQRPATLAPVLRPQPYSPK